MSPDTAMTLPPSNRLYVDLDDVISQTIERLLGVAEVEYGRRVDLDEVISFDLEKVFDLRPDEAQGFYDRSNQPDILADLALRPGAVVSLEAVRESGIEVWIVTGRPVHTAVSTQKWLQERAVPHDQVLFVDKYMYEDNHGPPGAPTAISLADLAGMRFRAAVEDHPETARFVAERMDTPVMLMDRPWNRAAAVDSHQLITRCRDWQEAAARLSELMAS